MSLQTDLQRVEYLMQLRPLVRDLKIKTKSNLKSLEKSTKYREEGNKLFQHEQTAQAILCYNKSLSYAPHPTVEEYLHPEPEANERHTQLHPEQENEKHTPVQMKDDSAPKKPSLPGLKILKKSSSQDEDGKQPNKFEALALCYANRSAALRRLCQYEDCLRDIARAARFGYPKENMFKLWERKGKCYYGLKRYELATKCIRQSLNALKECGLSELAKASKTTELQGLLKEWRSTAELAQMGNADKANSSAESPPQLMGATGPLVLISEPVKSRKVSEPVLPTQSAEAAAVPEGGTLGATTAAGAAATARPERRSMRKKAPNSPNGDPPMFPPDLQRHDSKMSISQISMGSPMPPHLRPDTEVPELSYGSNPRAPSASIGIDLRFAPEKGRFFVASQDLLPGDVILREEPYAAVLESIFRVNHCAHCLRKTPTPIPCYECATVQYCCETCRDLSWNEYHAFECGILACLEPSRYLGKMPHLALRIITKTGMQNLIQHSMSEKLHPTNLKNGNNKSDTEDTSTQSLTSLQTMFDPTNYRSVHNLATNSDKRNFEDLIKKTAEAIFMARCLKFNGFFGEGEEDASEETRKAENFISSLLLRHLQIASTNGLEMAECLLKNNDVTKFDIIPVGGAIFPTMSFFNHSCYPNALRLGYQGYQVIRVIRTIRRGDEVNIDYGFDFYANGKDMRQKRCTTQYHFACQCATCTQNWPVYNEMVNKPRRWKISMTQELMEEVERQNGCYQVGMEHLIRLDVQKALPLFKDYLVIMNELVEHPDQRYIDCDEAYKQCLWLENRGYKPKPANAQWIKG